MEIPAGFPPFNPRTGSGHLTDLFSTLQYQHINFTKYCSNVSKYCESNLQKVFHMYTVKLVTDWSGGSLCALSKKTTHLDFCNKTIVQELSSGIYFLFKRSLFRLINTDRQIQGQMNRVSFFRAETSLIYLHLLWLSKASILVTNGC